jgi:co-chaperonin GroES (HSP10)
LAFSEGPNKGYIAGISAIRNASSGNWNSQLAFYTSNDTTAGATTVQGINEWMRITSAGNVGIGTTAPGTKLDVVTTSASDGIRLVRGGLTKFYAQADGTLVWGASADSGKLSWNTNVAQIYGQSGQDLSLGSNANVDQLYIKSGGNVGIGTTNPTEKLHINGGRLLVNGSSYTLNPTGPIFGQYSSTIGYAQAPAGGNFEIWKDDTAAIATFTELGNVGIGTTTPSNTLDVNGTMRVRTFGGAAANNVCADANGVLSTCSGSFVTGTGTTNYLARWTSTSGIGIGATYDDGTNVGIGDATPTGLLTVGNGDKFVVDTNGRLRLNGATEAFGSYVISYDTGAASFSSASTVYGVKGTASNSSTGGVIGVSSVAASTGSGSLGSLIGLYSAQRLNNAGGTVGASAGLYVDSPTVTAGTISNQYGIFINSQKVGGVTGAYGIYQFELNDINYFAGNTAIGTTAMPQATLDVGGTASASGTLTLGNNSASILRPAAGAPLSLQYKSAANTWATALTVSNTSGNIGIGTTNPVHLLEINGTAADAANGIGFGTSGTVDTEIFRGAAGRVDFGASDYLNIPSALATTNNALNVTSTTTTLSSGRMLNIQKTGASGGTAFTGDIVRVDYSHTYNANTGIGHTGNVLDISRALTLNTAGNTHTVSGALMTLSDTMTQTAGTLTHTASVIDATQNYTSSTGTAFYLKNYGSNTSTTLRVDDASGDGSPFIIDATGNVGIGSTTVSTRLHLTGAPAAGSPWIGQMLVEPGINDEHAAISLKTTWTGTDRIWTILAGSGTPNTNFRIYDSTAGADRLNINDVGNVGIGTTDPLRKFHLNGSTSDVTLRVDTTNADPNLTFTTLTQKDWSLGIDYSDSGKFKIDDTTTVGGSTRMTIDTAGNVGINTASPLAKLDILASLGAPAITTANQTAGSTSEVVMNHTWTGNSGWDLRLEQQHVSGSHLQYNWINEWSGTPYNVLTFYGSSVGIGTTTPTRQSHIYGAAQATGSITDAGNTGGTLYLQDSGGSLGNGGTLLFGASQGNFASIKGYINDGSSNTTGSLTFATRANATDTALTERMIIDRFGNVIEGNLYLGYGTSAYLSTYDANENLIIDPNGSGYTHFQGTTLYVDNTIYARSTIENDTGFVDIRQSDTTYGLVLRQTGDSNDWGNIEVNETTLGFGKNNSVGQMFLDDDGDLGIGTSSPSNRLHVQDYTSGSTTASINGDTINWGLFIFNDGNNANRKGIGIQAGSDSGTGTSKLLDFYDGDATSLGDITFTGTTVAYNTFTGGHYVQVPENVDASGYEFGTLICIDSTSTTTGPDQATYQASKCSQKNQGSVAGVYAAKDENKPNHHQIFAVGDGSALVTSENGAIKRGDSIVASSYAGYGMKADGPSVILGVAVKDWIPSDEDRTLVLPDGRIVKGTLLPVYYYPGVFHPGPNTYFNSEGELVINGSTGNYQVTAVNGGAVANVLTAMTGIFGKVKAGLVSTQDLVVEQSASITSLSVTNLTVAGQSIQSYVASLVQQQLTTTPVQVTSTPAQIATSSAQIANLSAQTITTNTATVSSSLTAPVAIIQDLQASTLTTTGTTALGSLLAENATISGSLTAEDLTVTGTSRLDILEAQQAELQDLKTTTAEILDATVSGTLYAENIYDLDGKISRALQQPSIMDIITNNLPEPLPEADPVTVYDEVESAGYTINPDMLSITGSEVSLINGDVLLTAQAAYVEKYLQVNGLAYIAQSLGVGETIILGNTTIISDRSIAYTPTSVDDIFYFQPTGEGKLDFLAGVLTIENGKVAITGSLTVAGTTKTETLLTNLIQPAEFGNPFQVQVAGISTESGELKKSRFEIINELGTPVATISAEGKANFAGGIGIGSETLTPPTVASGSSATVTASKTSGKSTLGAHATQITIESEQISENSLIYVTPVGSTQNQVLYVKSQTAENPTTGEKEGKFIVGFDQPINIDVNFNWWVVN